MKKVPSLLLYICAQSWERWLCLVCLDISPRPLAVFHRICLNVQVKSDLLGPNEFGVLTHAESIIALRVVMIFSVSDYQVFWVCCIRRLWTTVG